MFFKKKKIILEAYAPIGDLVDLFPPVRADEITPKWYQSLPAKPMPGLTVKHCPGIRDMLSKGFIIPLWADYNVTIASHGLCDITSGMENTNVPPLTSHPIDFQAANAWPNHINLKFNNPWVFWCSEPIEWVWVQPTMWQQHPQELILVPGITEFRYQSTANINTITALPDEPVTLSFKAGTPMAQLVPLIKDDWELKVDVLTPDIYARKFANWKFSLTHHAQYLQRKNIISGKTKCKY